MRRIFESWLEKKDYTAIFSSKEDNVSRVYKCKAYIETDEGEEALRVSGKLYESDNSNPEFVHLHATSLRVCGQIEVSVEVLKEFVDCHGDSLSILRRLIEELVLLGRYGEVAFYNDKRDVSHNSVLGSNCLALQCFNKPDLLERTLISLLGCKEVGSYSLVILQDNYLGSNYKKNYEEGYNQVRKIITKYYEKLNDSFLSVTVISNPLNKGTAPSCRALMDYCFSIHDAVMFIEDDFLLSEDALSWSSYAIKHVVGKSDVYFATCESIFFDSKGVPIDAAYKNKMTEIASNNKLLSSYVEESFVPSTCFITTKIIWNMCSSLRGAIRGPETLNSWLNSEGKKTAIPIVPRGHDVGMFDENGYSVEMLGKSNVKEVKSGYLVSKNKNPLENVEKYEGDKNLIYSASVLINEGHAEKLLRSFDKE